MITLGHGTVVKGHSIQGLDEKVMKIDIQICIVVTLMYKPEI
jgi:hypothetical protein